MSAFNGTYVLDSAKSGNVDKLLTAQGVGWIQRNAMAMLSQTITITIDGDKLTIKQETSLKTTEVTLTLGGAPEDFTDDVAGGPAKRSAHLDGDKLVQVIETSNGVLTNTRTLESDGKVLKANLHFVPKSGETVTVDRFFNRK